MTAASNLLARIAALHPSDRQWLLAQASAETRARLTNALESAHRGAFSARDMIASATPEHVACALQTQPAWLAAVLLQMDEWPWSAALLKRSPGMQRAIVGQPAPALKPALAAAILNSFARSLAISEASTLPTPSPRLPAFDALVQRFRRGQEPGF